MITKEQVTQAREKAVKCYSDYMDSVQDTYTHDGVSHERIMKQNVYKAAWHDADKVFAEILNKYAKQ